MSFTDNSGVHFQKFFSQDYDITESAMFLFVIYLFWNISKTLCGNHSINIISLTNHTGLYYSCYFGQYEPW